MSVDERIESFLAQGVCAEDVPGLSLLRSARESMDVLVALFRGGEPEVMVRLLVLREIAARVDCSVWTPQDLESHFAWLDPVKLETVLTRLRAFHLLLWDPLGRVYRLAPIGRMVVSALSILLNASQGDAGADYDLGFLTAQVAATQAVGAVSAEALAHLLARLNELMTEFDAAVDSGSEFRLRAAQSRLDSVWHWVEQGSKMIRTLMSDEELPVSVWRTAQAIGEAQSRLLRMASAFNRALHALESQRVHLGQSGLSSFDIAEWLRIHPHLDQLAEDILSLPVRLSMVTGSEMLDMAEYELLDRARAAPIDPASLVLPAVAEIESIDLVREPQRVLERWLPSLQRLTASRSLYDIVVAPDYAQTAYRMSLLPLLDDPAQGRPGDALGDFVRLPLVAIVSAEVMMVDHPEIAAISVGQIAPKNRMDMTNE